MATTTDTAERELVLSRLLKAPRALVFDSWSNPEAMGKWWGPTGFTTTTHEMAFSVGGVWRFTMHGPDGTDYPNRIVYTEIVRPERICYDHGDDDGADNPQPNFQVLVSFEDRDGKTFLTMRIIVATAEQLEGMKKFGAVEGGIQTLDRLEQYLAEQV